jgi:hypothetical protein
MARTRKTDVQNESAHLEHSSEEEAVAETKTEYTGTISSRGRGRSNRSFPAGSFKDALQFATEIFNFGSGQPVRRLSIFDQIGRTPDSSASRQLITNSNKYGLIKGNYKSDQIELTQEGAKVCDERTNARESARLRAKLAVQEIEVFGAVYEKLVGSKLPARAALMDMFKTQGVAQEYLEESTDTFIVNLTDVGLLQTLSGADRVISVDHLLDGITPSGSAVAAGAQATLRVELVTQDVASFESACFYVTPIGIEDSEARRHSNLFLESIIEPAISTLGLRVIRGDLIDKPGVITRQTLEYLFKARLVIVDLSFSNANVFYELAIRHCARLPVVQIVRYGDPIPFDINQMRTIIIDNRDIYTLLPRVEGYRAEIANQARRALEAGAEVDTPVSVYFPQAKLSLT